MNVLEKILEDIRNMRDIMKSTVAADCFGKECENDDCTVCVCERAMEIISSYMDEIRTLKKKPVWEMDVMHHESYDLGRNIGWNECLETMQQNTNDGWIPVEERLPEEGKEVIAQFVVRVIHINGTVDEEVYIHPLYYENGVWKSFAGVPNGRVEAWQPLPEAYHPKQIPAAEHIMSRFTRVE